MAEPLDMSLDDIIKSKQKGQNGNFRGRGGRGFNSGGPGPARRLPNREPTRIMPYMAPQMLAIGGSGNEVETKLYISNLDYGVSNEDIKDLFSEVGILKKYSINYDRSGRSKGTAEVIYTRQADALAAIQRYNNVQLDGKPMKLEFVGVNIITAAQMPPTTSSILGKPNGGFRRQDGILGRGAKRSRIVSRGRRPARGHGQGGKGHGEKVSAESLDADLEKYRLEAMKIN